MTIREAEAEVRGEDYPWVERAVKRVRLASNGQKRAHERTLRKKRLASLKREIARFGRAGK